MDHKLVCKFRGVYPKLNEKYHELIEIDCFGIKVSYSIANDGSGTLFKEGFIRTLKNLFPNKTFNRCFEWCSGPGFIGFSVLANNITNHLVLGDIHKTALDEALVTAKKNNIEDRVSLYLSDNWENIPKHEKFDLIIGDPPMFNYTHYQHEYFNFDSRLFLDIDWNIHRSFFSGAAEHLTDDGSIIILENTYGAGINTFKDMINNSGLFIFDHFYQDKTPGGLWYMHIKKNNGNY